VSVAGAWALARQSLNRGLPYRYSGRGGSRAAVSLASGFASLSHSTVEKTVGNFSIVRSRNPSEACSVQWRVEGTGADPVLGERFDGGELPSGTATFAAGQTSVAAAVVLAIRERPPRELSGKVLLENPDNCTIDEGHAEFDFVLTAAVIDDDAVVGLDVPFAELVRDFSEAVAYDFDVVRSGDATGACSVQWRFDGVGTNPVVPADFVGGVLPSGTASFLGITYDRPYADDAAWNRPVIGQPQDPASATLAAKLWANPNINCTFSGFTYPVYELTGSEDFYTVTSATPRLDGEQIKLDPAWLPSGGFWEGDAEHDAQMIILDPATGEQWNLWQVREPNVGAKTVQISNGSLCVTDYRTGSGANPHTRGSGLDYLAMLVRPAEVADGAINHALSMPFKGILNTADGFVAPANSSDGDETSDAVAGGVPTGTRYALDISDAEIDSWAAALSLSATGKLSAKVIARALRDYGWVVTDNSGSNHLQFEDAASAEAAWTDLGLPPASTAVRDMLDGIWGTGGSRIYAIVPSDEYVGDPFVATDRVRTSFSIAAGEGPSTVRSGRLVLRLPVDCKIDPTAAGRDLALKPDPNPPTGAWDITAANMTLHLATPGDSSRVEWLDESHGGLKITGATTDHARNIVAFFNEPPYRDYEVIFELETVEDDPSPDTNGRFIQFITAALGGFNGSAVDVTAWTATQYRSSDLDPVGDEVYIRYAKGGRITFFNDSSNPDGGNKTRYRTYGGGDDTDVQPAPVPDPAPFTITGVGTIATITIRREGGELSIAKSPGSEGAEWSSPLIGTLGVPDGRIGFKFARGRGGIIRHSAGSPFIRELVPDEGGGGGGGSGDELPDFDRVLTVGYGSGSLRFDTIAAAMAAARDGDVIKVNPTSNAYPATSMSKAGVWLMVNGSPLSARIASINLPAARTGVWGFDCGASACDLRGDDAIALRCWWHGDRRGSGSPQLSLEGDRAMLGHCKLSDSTSCGIGYHGKNNVIFRTLVDDLKGNVNGCEAIGSNRQKSPNYLACLLDHVRIDRFAPTANENEALSNKSGDNIFRFVTLARSRFQLTNRHGGNNTYYGCWVDTEAQLSVRDRGNRFIGCGGPGVFIVRPGSMTVDQWRANPGNTPATTRPRAEDTLLVGPDFAKGIKVGQPNSANIETVPCINTRIEKNLGGAVSLQRQTNTSQVTAASISYPVAKEVAVGEVGPTSPWTGYPTR
jgi:hypothetical protein